MRVQGWSCILVALRSFPFQLHLCAYNLCHLLQQNKVQNCPWLCDLFTVIHYALTAVFKAAFASTGHCKKGTHSHKHLLGR